jgi:hypothetical protein
VVGVLNQFFKISKLKFNWKNKVVFWCIKRQPKFNWVDKFTWKWILERKFSKLLCTPFGVDLETKDMDKFSIEQLKKKFKYWFSVPLPLVNKTLIVNSMLTASLWFSINVGGGGGGGGGVIFFLKK